MGAVTIAVNLVGNNFAAGAFGSLGQSLFSLKSNAESLAKSFANLSTTTKGAGIAAIAGGIAFAAFKAPLEYGFQAAADLESQLVRLKIATESNSDAMPVLTAAVNDLAVKTVYGSSEAANAFEQMSEEGFNVSQILYGAGASANEYSKHAYDAKEATSGLGMQALVLGQAMKTGATDGAELLGSAMNTFRNQTQLATKDGLSAAQMANILAGAYFNGVPDAQALGSAIQMSGAQASTAGIKVQDFVTMLDLLSQAGMSGTQAGSSLSYMIQSMIAPTQKQSKMLSDLGIVTVNTSAKYREFEASLVKAGAASKDDIKLWDGSVAGLQKMFTAAQQAGKIPLDQNFQQWALANHFMNSQLFDGAGKFKGMKDAVLILDNAMKGMTVEQKMAALGDLFNIRSGRAARILTDITDFSGRYDTLWKRIGSVDVTKAAQEQLGTFKGAWDAFTDSMKSGLAVALMPFLQFGTRVISFLNDLIGKFMQANPVVQKAVGGFLILGTALAGTVAVLGTVAFLVGAFHAALALLSGILLPVIAGILVIIAVAAEVAAAFIFIKTQVMAAHGAFSFLRPIVETVGNLFRTFGNFVRSEVLPTLKQFEGVGKAIALVLGGALVVGGLLLIGVFVAVAAIIMGVVFVLTKLGEGIVWVRDHISQLPGVFTSAWNGAKTAVGNFFNWLGTTIHNKLEEIKKGAEDKWNSMVQGVQHFIDGVRSKAESGWNTITGIFKGAIDKVVGFFNWLYAHNYYFQNWVDGQVAAIHRLQAMWNAAVSFLRGLWNGAVGIASSAWNRVSSVVGSAANNARTAVTNAWNQVTGATSSAWSSVSGTVSSFTGRVSGTVGAWGGDIAAKARAAWNQFVSAITGAVGQASGAAHSVLNAVTNALTGLGSMLFNSGRNAINMLADGVRSALGNLGSAAHSAADIIAKLLGFHSPTKEGPGSDADTWMPNLMKMAASGLTDNLPKLKSAAGLVAQTLHGAFAVSPQTSVGSASNNVQSLQAALSQAARSTQPTNAGQVVIPINLDGKQLGNYVLDLATGKLRQSGINRMGR